MKLRSKKIMVMKEEKTIFIKVIYGLKKKKKHGITS